MNNMQRFIETLTAQYEELFVNDPAYAHAASKTTPAELAEKITNGLKERGALIEGPAVRNTCEILGVKWTVAGIENFLRK